MYQRLSITDLLDLALGTSEPSAVNFNILYRVLLCILKEINIQSVKTDYYKFDEEFYMHQNQTKLQEISEFESSIIKIVHSSPTIFQKIDDSPKEEEKNITESVAEPSSEEESVISVKNDDDADHETLTADEEKELDYVKEDEISSTKSPDVEDTDVESDNVEQQIETPTLEEATVPTTDDEAETHVDDDTKTIVDDETKSTDDDETKSIVDDKPEPTFDDDYSIDKMSLSSLNDQKLGEVHEKYDQIIEDVIQKINSLEEHFEQNIIEVNKQCGEKEEKINDKIIKFHEEFEDLLKSVQDHSTAISNFKDDITNMQRNIENLDSEKVNREEMDEMKIVLEKYQKEINEKVSLVEFQSVMASLRNDMEKISDDLSEFSTTTMKTIAENQEYAESEFQKVKDNFAKQEEENTEMKGTVSKIANEVKISKASLNILRGLVIKIQQQLKVAAAGTTKCVSCGKPAFQSGGDSIRQGKLHVSGLKLRNKNVQPDYGSNQNDNLDEAFFPEKKKGIYVPIEMADQLHKADKLEEKIDKWN